MFSNQNSKELHNFATLLAKKVGVSFKLNIFGLKKKERSKYDHVHDQVIKYASEIKTKHLNKQEHFK